MKLLTLVPVRTIGLLTWDAKTKLLSSIDKAKDILGYKPTVSFDDGLERVYGWFTDNWENIERDAEF